MPTTPMRVAVCIFALFLTLPVHAADRPLYEWEKWMQSGKLRDFLDGKFLWKADQPLIAPQQIDANDIAYCVKEPSAVFVAKQWHVFCTVRSEKHDHRIEQITFSDWKSTASAQRRYVDTDGLDAGCPQIFYFEPKKQWCLIFQTIDRSKSPDVQPVIMTASDLSQLTIWSKPLALVSERPKNVRLWSGFWVICDDAKAYLFFSSADGQLWRTETKLADFPSGFGRSISCRSADVIGTPRIYKLKGFKKYIAVMEAQESGRRYWKAFMSDHLNSARWEDLASWKTLPLAAPRNILETLPHWIDSIGIGEILRDDPNQKMEIDHKKMRLLFHAVSDELRYGQDNGHIPWRIGLLEPAN